MGHAHLEFEITSETMPGDGPGQPKLPKRRTGIRIGAEEVRYDGDKLSFRLMATYALPSPLFRAFQSVEEALFVTLECPSTGQSASFDFQDKFSEPEPRSGPNYLGDPDLSGPAARDIEGGAVALEVSVAIPDAPPGPVLYATAHLREMVSNTLAFDARGGSVASTEGGAPGAR